MGAQADAQQLLRAGNPVARSVSVAGDGSVWAVGADGAIVHATEGVEPWTTVPGTASSLALTAESNVVAVMHGTIAIHERGGEGEWEPLPARPPFPAAAVALEEGAAPGQNVLWAIDAERGVWASLDGTEPWEAAGVTADVLAATSDGSLYRLDVGALYLLKPGSSPWVPIETPEPFADVSAGATGFIWGVGSSGSVYQYDGGSSWETIAPPTMEPGRTRIAAGEDMTVWLLCDGGIWSYDPAEAGWSPVGWEAAAPPAQLAVANLETIWAIDVQGGVHRYTEDAGAWEPLRADGLPRFDQVSAVDARELWTLEAGGAIATLTESGGRWQSAPAPGEGWIGVSASADVVWALGGAGDAHEWVDGAWQARSAVPVKAISVGGSSVAAVGAGGAVLAWEAYAGEWAAVEPALGEAAVDVSVLPGGSIWAVTTAGGLAWYLDQWIEVAGPRLTQVAAGPDGAVWAIEADGVVVDLSGGGPLGEVPVARRRARLPQWDAEEPFDEAESTHLWIVNRAAVLAQGQGRIGRAVCALVKPGQGRIEDPFHDNLCQGLYDADWKPEYNNPVLGEPTYASHFFDAEDGENWMGDTVPTAVTQGSQYFELAVTRYRGNSLEAAGYALGLSLHYFTDLTQPMHAANYTWLSSHPRWGYHTAFEAYVMEIQSTIEPPTRYAPFASQTPEELLIAAAYASKHRYYEAICPWWSVANYYRFTSYYKGIAREQAPAILREAITSTAQYLVRWMEAAD